MCYYYYNKNPESEFRPDLPSPEPQDATLRYDHFYQHDECWQNPKYGKVPPAETMCWLACLTMGIQALSQKFSQEEAYEKAVQIYSGKTFDGRIADDIFSSEGLDLEIDIVRRQDLKPERAVGKLGTLLNEGKMIFLRLTPHGQGQPGHLVLVAGHREGRFLISDPTLQAPFWLNQDRLPEIFMGEQPEAERKSDPRIALYVLGKKA